MDAFGEARALHSIRSVLGVRDNKQVMICPLPRHNHTNYTPSFSIFFKDGVERWKCHGSCNLEGDVIDLVGYLYVPGYNPDNPEHCYKALCYVDAKYEIDIPKKERKVMLSGAEWRRYLPARDEVIRYARLRGLTLETVDRFNVGQDKGAMTIPVFENEILLGIKFRSTNKKSRVRFWSLPGSKPGLFNYDNARHNQFLFIVKSEIPAMLLDQYGLPVVAPTSGEGAWLDDWTVKLAFKKLIYIGDNDDPGRRAAEKLKDILKCEIRFPNPDYKDVDEWILADIDAINLIRRWQHE